jgi:hypothetical protein
MCAMDPRRGVRFGHRSALFLLVGLLLTGPAAVAGISFRHPQPVAWRGPEAYGRAFHPLQLATYLFGFLILPGAVGLFAALLGLAPR